ncbi:MAG: hypothetical protein E6X19_13165 [Hungatella hathewayi]|jgi:flagellar biosynthesis/type III secretory pathway M-ring protein FliF/YscJ|uniref:hypothetical protein n=1 Tax=Hungatella TaxID=1649459 RepID=UPI0011DD5AB2|nr:hypothetical protein [Hungatella hathewayi]MDU4973652.1 hypothetical protein [Hungatella hathewayi]
MKKLKERFKEKFHLNLINILFWISSIYIIINIIGIVITPYISKKMENVNYLFSDNTDMQRFEAALDSNDIPYEILTDDAISIPADWKDSGAEIYQECFD